MRNILASLALVLLTAVAYAGGNCLASSGICTSVPMPTPMDLANLRCFVDGNQYGFDLGTCEAKAIAKYEKDHSGFLSPCHIVLGEEWMGGPPNSNPYSFLGITQSGTSCGSGWPPGRNFEFADMQLGTGVECPPGTTGVGSPLQSCYCSSSTSYWQGVARGCQKNYSTGSIISPILLD